MIKRFGRLSWLQILRMCLKAYSRSCESALMWATPNKLTEESSECFCFILELSCNLSSSQRCHAAGCGVSVSVLDNNNCVCKQTQRDCDDAKRSPNFCNYNLKMCSNCKTNRWAKDAHENSIRFSHSAMSCVLWLIYLTASPRWRTEKRATFGVFQQGARHSECLPFPLSRASTVDGRHRQSVCLSVCTCVRARRRRRRRCKEVHCIPQSSSRHLQRHQTSPTLPSFPHENKNPLAPKCVCVCATHRHTHSSPEEAAVLSVKRNIPLIKWHNASCREPPRDSVEFGADARGCPGGEFTGMRKHICLDVH